MNDENRITTENILKTLPDVLKCNDKFYALATAISHVLAEQREEIRKIALFTAIDDLPEAVVDILAGDFKIDWYDYNADIAQKRGTVKDNFRVHKKLGTRKAIDDALHSKYPNSEISEWFDYDGDPYCFKIKVYADCDFDFDKIIETIECVKRASAKLEQIEIVSTEKIDCYQGFASVLVSECKFTLPSSEFDVDLYTDESGLYLTDECNNLLTP